MIKKNKMKSLLALLLAVCACGCGQGAQQVATDNEIVLLEPVVEGTSGERAEYRNLYNFKTYSASVYPVTTEYSYAKTTEREKFGVYFGESVKKNTVLVYGSTEKLDEQITEMEEQITLADQELAEAEADLIENLAPSKANLDGYKWAYEAYMKIEPPEKIPSSDPNSTEMVVNPEYAPWKVEKDKWEGQYRILGHSINMQEEAMRQRKELYALERAYMCERLEALKKSRKEKNLLSKAEGEVVALDIMGSYSMNAEQSVIAVGDMNQKVLLTDYISKADISKAADYYALINGKRYDVEYVAISNEEYAKLTAAGEKPCTTFKFLGDTSEVEIGGYAVITIFSDKKENVLSVPKSAVHKDDSGNYVYVMKGSESIYTPVKTGVSDGVYTEIVSGLSQGDVVMTASAMMYSNETVAVGYGSYSTQFQNSGRMVYWDTENVINPIEYGTVYFGEYQVAAYEHVEKGDVIATVRVKADDITIQRGEIALQRARERLADLEAENDESNAESIEAWREEIEEVQAIVDEMKSDGGVTQIRATRSGIITSLADLDNESIVDFEAVVATISDPTTCYLQVENTNQILNYGNEVSISYRANDDTIKESFGVVASVASMGVSVDLQSEYSYILLPEESIADMAVTNLRRENYWNPYRYEVTATVREMNDILVVPKQAVREVSGRTYVYVKDEQGNVKAVSFVAAGSNTTEYWVIEGLTEGMVLCLK